jgi:hypothetical protein
MKRYQVTAADDLFSRFSRVGEDINLDAFDRKQRGAYPSGPGIYYWVMRCGNDRFKIYVGRTTSLRRRVCEYANEFQPGVPNDYKMRHFQRWMRERFSDAQLDLYFCETPNRIAEEKEVVRKTRPFINVPSGSDSAALREANWKYYCDGFNRRCA